MIAILLDDNSFEQDIRELLMAFYPGEAFTHKREEAHEARLLVKGGKCGCNFDLYIEDNEGAPEDRTVSFASVKPDFTNRFEAKNLIKRTLYSLLRTRTGTELPWGTLTGIRPTKIALTKLQEGRDARWIRDYMRETYCTSDEKISLALDVAKRELALLETVNYEKGYSLYIGIHFVPPPACTVLLPHFQSGNGRGRQSSIWTLCSGRWITWQRR